jgi:3'-phosphoadenosine 5'-phosphosulfate sulfotransferase (PAPS reductase)/FAD synthetase
MFSGGVGSWAAAKRVAQTYGTDDLYLVFSDVSGEDEDCYRFLTEAADNVGGELVWLKDGRTIWDVFRHHRMLGNTRIAKCSHVLKQEPARRWLKENTDPADTAVYVGIDWSESHRLAAVERNYDPWVAFAPLTEPPYLDKADMIAWCEAEGIKPPRMYAEGFPHANCAGGCVKAGQGQFKLLYEQRPEVYAEWERQEQGLRDYLGKDVAILRDRRGGTTKPLTLTALRQRIECSPESVDADDLGGCGCFVDD